MEKAGTPGHEHFHIPDCDCQSEYEADDANVLLNSDKLADGNFPAEIFHNNDMLNERDDEAPDLVSESDDEAMPALQQFIESDDEVISAKGQAMTTDDSDAESVDDYWSRYPHLSRLKPQIPSHPLSFKHGSKQVTTRSEDRNTTPIPARPSRELTPEKDDFKGRAHCRTERIWRRLQRQDVSSRTVDDPPEVLSGEPQGEVKGPEVSAEGRLHEQPPRAEKGNPGHSYAAVRANSDEAGHKGCSVVEHPRALSSSDEGTDQNREVQGLQISGCDHRQSRLWISRMDSSRDQSQQPPGLPDPQGSDSGSLQGTGSEIPGTERVWRRGTGGTSRGASDDQEGTLPDRSERVWKPREGNFTRQEASSLSTLLFPHGPSPPLSLKPP